MPARARTTLFLILAVAFGRAAAADPLTLDDAARRALESDARLRAESAILSASEAQATLDALPPPLTLGAELENVAGTGEVSGLTGAEATVRISRLFERGGKRAARRRVGDAQVERQRHRVEARRTELMAEVATRFVDVVAAESALSLASKQVATATELSDAVAYRVERGVTPEADARLAEIAVARAQLAREHAEHELLVARSSLAVLFGAEAPDFTAVAGALEPLPPMPALDMLAARLDGTPGQRALALEADELDARRALAETQRTPDVTASIGVRRLETFDDQALVASFSVPLGMRGRGELAVARARADRDSIDARIEAERMAAYRDVFALFQELKHARTEYTLVGESMIPAAQEAVALTRAGYDQARYSFLQLAQARAALADLERQRIEAAALYHQKLAAIERATAQSEGTLR